MYRHVDTLAVTNFVATFNTYMFTGVVPIRFIGRLVKKAVYLLTCPCHSNLQSRE